MELSSISKPFVFAAIIYLVVLAYGIGFILSNLAFGGLTLDFWLIFFIIMLPLFLFAVYLNRSSAEFLSAHEVLLRRLIILLIAVAAVFVAVFIVPLGV